MLIENREHIRVVALPPSGPRTQLVPQTCREISEVALYLAVIAVSWAFSP
jgi:hypothetical protein